MNINLRCQFPYADYLDQAQKLHELMIEYMDEQDVAKPDL
jgi:hypothetical protein